jgi:hypothetical protein
MSGLTPNLTAEEQGRRAAELINDALLNMIFAEMDTTAADAWRRSTSPVQREEMYYTVIAIADLRKRLNERLEQIKLNARRDTIRGRPTD